MTALFFFVGASSMLITMYLLRTYIKFIIELLISFQATICLSILITEFAIRTLLFRNISDDILKDKLQHHFLTREHKVSNWFGTVSLLDFVSLLLGLSIVLSWFLTRNWIFNNILAVCLGYLFLKAIKIATIKPALILLTCLFFYDIFWVFITPYFTKGESVMVAVASSFDIPIKLYMPIFSDLPSGIAGCSMLGLGDIVIPGLYIVFMNKVGTKLNNTKYFKCSILAYLLSLIVCVACLWIFNSA